MHACVRVSGPRACTTTLEQAEAVKLAAVQIMPLCARVVPVIPLSAPQAGISVGAECAPACMHACTLTQTHAPGVQVLYHAGTRPEGNFLGHLRVWESCAGVGAACCCLACNGASCGGVYYLQCFYRVAGGRREGRQYGRHGNNTGGM